MSWREKARRLRLGLATLFGRRQGFFIPYRYAAGIPSTQPVYTEIETLFAAAETEMRRLLRGIAEHEIALQAIAAERTSGPRARFDQDWFPTLDACAAYALLREIQPARVIEVGSGHSTRFLARAVKDGGFGCHIRAIDPAPRADIAGLGVDILPMVVQQADPALFDSLHAGDLLFIDSSHILMPGSDVDWLFSRVLPRLPSGCWLQVHDIFLPDDYPPAWLWRGYNEQNLLAGLLGTGWRLVFASHYAATRLGTEVMAGPVGRLPAAPGALPASLWLQKR